MSFVGQTLVPAPHGQLEAIYHPAGGSAERAALILHPHPLYGGTMHNKVVYQTAKALEAAGFATLRINFRGVGTSTGDYDDGRGELDDARVGLDYLLTDQPRAREVVVAGFSFGAAVALSCGCADRRVQRIIAIATPARWLAAGLLAECAKPIAFIHGADDDLAPLAAVQDLQRSAGRPDVQLRVIPGADHFFEHHLEALRTAVREIVSPVQAE